MMKSLLAAAALTTAVAIAPAFADDNGGDTQGASQVAPGHLKGQDQSAKDVAPGQVKGEGESAKDYAPGQQTDHGNNGGGDNNDEENGD